MRVNITEGIQSLNLPKVFSLSQNYPNPCNPNTKIDNALPKPCQVNIKIYSILDQTVWILIDEYQEAGEKSIIWDGTNSEGGNVATGLYFYHIEAGDFVKTKNVAIKITLSKINKM